MLRVRCAVVTYNPDINVLKTVLSAIERQTFRDAEYVIWDNASANADAIAALKLPASVRLVRCETNLGFAAANNRALLDAPCDYVAVLNPDAIPAPDWLEALVAALDARPDFSMCASLQIKAADSGIMDGAGDCLSYTGFAFRGGEGQPLRDLPKGEVFGPCGAAAIYRRSSFNAARGFDEEFFCYGEDVDLALRLRRAGERCLFAPEARVNHYGSLTSGATSDFTVFHSARNRMWMVRYHMPFAIRVWMLPLHGLFAAYLLLRLYMRRSPMASAFRRGTAAGLRRKPGGAKRAPASAPGGTGNVLRAISWGWADLPRQAVTIRRL